MSGDNIKINQKTDSTTKPGHPQRYRKKFQNNFSRLFQDPEAIEIFNLLFNNYAYYSTLKRRILESSTNLRKLN